jgi:DNA repair photolyase
MPWNIVFIRTYMNTSSFAPPQARGAGFNPPNRFEKLALELEPEALVDDEGNPLPLRTQFFRDDTQTIIAFNESPDVSFRAGVSPYRGCEHGCAYCFARPYHEYLGFSAGLDFESKIMVKMRAAELLRTALSKKSWEPQPIAMSGATDVYQPVERRLGLTRACLAVCAEFRQPVSIITKNHLVTRDADLLGELAKSRAASVCVSLTTLDGDLAKELEPRASTPGRRLAAIAELRGAGVPVHVLTAPIIPGLNEHEIPALLDAAAQAGAVGASYTILRLPFAVAPIFEEWLEKHRPGHKAKVLGRVRELRGGRLNDPRFGSRMRGEGALAEQIKTLFEVARRKAGLAGRERIKGLPVAELSTAAFRVPTAQMPLFEE